MSQIETVFGYTKKIEGLLDKEFKAQGRGLHTKLNSIEYRLPAALVKKIRWIATIRNNLAHAEDFKIDNIEDFTKSCESVIAELEDISKNGQPLAINELGNSARGAPISEFRAGRSAIFGERIHHERNSHSRPKVVSKRKNTLAFSWLLAVLLVLTCGLMIWVWQNPIPFLALFNHSSRPTESGHDSAASNNGVVYSQYDSSKLSQFYDDLDKRVFKYLSKNTKTWLDQQELVKNGDGTYDIHVMLHWEVSEGPLLNVLNKYFWGDSKTELKAGMTNFGVEYKAPSYGIRIIGQNNATRNQKSPYSQELYNYLVSRQVVIKVSIGHRFEHVTIASGRQCIASCNGIGKSQFQIHLSNKGNPETLMASSREGEQNPVVIKGVTSGEFKTVKSITTAIEILEP